MSKQKEKVTGKKKHILIGAFVAFLIIGFISGHMQNNNNDNSSATATTVATTTKEETTAAKKVETGTYKIDGINFTFTDNVRNDVTGNWRISLISDNIQPKDYVADYYKQMFTSDDEIHAIVNFNYNTTTKISVLTEEELDITVLEYVKGEEHDAKELFGGTLLEEYTYNIKTKKIEKIQ